MDVGLFDGPDARQLALSVLAGGWATRQTILREQLPVVKERAAKRFCKQQLEQIERCLDEGTGEKMGDVVYREYV